MDRNYLAADRQAEAKPLALRRIERVEEPLPACEFDADASVGDRYRDVASSGP
jgi:hypothetical protein